MGIRLLMNVVYAVAMVQVVVEPIPLILREVVGTLPTPAVVIRTKTEITQLLSGVKMGKLTHLTAPVQGLLQDADGTLQRDSIIVWNPQMQELRIQAENILVIVRNWNLRIQRLSIITIYPPSYGYGSTRGDHSTPLFSPEERCILLLGSDTNRQVIASMKCLAWSHISTSVLKMYNSGKN